MRFNHWDEATRDQAIEILEDMEKQRQLRRIIEFSEKIAAEEKCSNVVNLAAYRKLHGRGQCPK